MPIVLFDALKEGDDIILCMYIKGNNHLLMSNTVCLTLKLVIPILNKYQRSLKL